MAVRKPRKEPRRPAKPPVRPELRLVKKPPIMPIKPMAPKGIGGRPLSRETLRRYQASLDTYYQALKSYRKAMTVKRTK